jgi:hypothetical protein
MRFAATVFALLATTIAARAQAVTTRIETRPYYGAITTIEHGVRVTRALPAHDRIIINPDRTPLSLNIGGGGGEGGGNTVIQQNSSTTIGGQGYGVPLGGGRSHGHRLAPHKP